MRPGQHQYHVAQAKWTSTLSPKLMVDAGWSLSDITWNVDYRPGVQQERGTPRGLRMRHTRTAPPARCGWQAPRRR